VSTVESDLDVSGAAPPAVGDELRGTEVTQARIGQRFGTVTGYHGAPLAAPPLDPVRLARKAR
jgi:hypothetical protein